VKIFDKAKINELRAFKRGCKKLHSQLKGTKTRHSTYQTKFDKENVRKNGPREKQIEKIAKIIGRAEAKIIALEADIENCDRVIAASRRRRMRMRKARSRRRNPSRRRKTRKCKRRKKRKSKKLRKRNPKRKTCRGKKCRKRKTRKKTRR